MSIEELARTASTDLLTHTSADPDAGLDAVLAAHSRRHRHSRAATAIAAVAAVAVTWWGGASFGGHAADREPTPGPSVPTRTKAVCQSALVTCLGTRTYRFALDVPVTWHVPRGFGVDSGAGATTIMVESYWRHHGHPAGVSVLEGVSAPSRTGESASVHAGPATPDSFVHWLATRPFLVASTPRRTTIDGRPAWLVRVSLKPHAGAGADRCLGASGVPCHPLTYQDVRTTTGIWGDMVADYTAFELPGNGTAVVWSWAFGHDTAALAHNQQLVGGLSWPTG
jgi:hypothetical protein